MSRKIIPLITTENYHIFNRGVDKRDIFLDKFDYIRFYQSLDVFNSVDVTTNFRLAKYNSQHSDNVKKLVKIIAYSLLPNHFHLILKQEVDGGISEFIKRVCVGYTGYFNEKNFRSGALIQGRFKRVHIDTNEQMQYLFAYVNENHFVHGFNINRELYQSSSLHYQGIASSKLIQKSQDVYNYSENVKLAVEIYEKRKLAKAMLLDD